MKKLILTIAILLITNIAYSAEIIIPFGCFPKELQKAFHSEGYKLDINAEDRTRESWGFLKCEGSRFIIYTYDQPTQEDFKTITKIIFGGINE